MRRADYSIGYFADYGKRPSKVHLVKDGVAVCGYDSKMAYQWCALSLDYTNIHYITCFKCREAAGKLLEKHILGHAQPT